MLIKSLERPFLLVYITTGAKAYRFKDSKEGEILLIRGIKGGYKGGYKEGYILFTIAGQIPINSLEKSLLLVYITTGAKAYRIKGSKEGENLLIRGIKGGL
jgi:hypothetical protein